VPFRQEVLGKVVTDFPASGDDDVHARRFLGAPRQRRSRRA
jgi:hypothetical protein